MRPDLVVVLAPLLDGDLGFDAVPKPLQAQVLVPKLPVERFVGAILPRLPGVNERRFDLRRLYPALDRPRPQHVQRWLNDLEKRGLSARTRQYGRAILRSALSQAVRWGHLSRNVAALVDAPRVSRHEIRPLSPEQARGLLLTARGHRLEALVTVALAMGLRQGEALGLKWDAVDLEAGTLDVRVALQRVNREWRLVEPKSDRSRRRIALPNVAVVALRAQKVRQLETRLLAGGRWVETGLVFTSAIGTPLEPSNVTKQFHRLLRDAGIPKVRFHDLRHTAATFLLAQGVDPRTIMETL